MLLTGISASTLAALGGALTVATVILYVLKLRRRPVEVPFALIWKRVLKDDERRNLFSRLRRILSLLLQLALVALVLLALGKPVSKDAWSHGKSIVLLVDVSASMGATDVSPNRLEVAKQKVRGLLTGLASNDRALIAEMGATPRPLCTMTGRVDVLDDALSRLALKDVEANLQDALLYALDSLKDAPHPQIVLLSDGNLGPLELGTTRSRLEGVELSYLPIGETGPNVGITQFAVRRYPLDTSRYEALVEITNTFQLPAEIELTLRGDDDVVDVTKLRVEPGESLSRIYANLGGASARLEASIRRTDGVDLLPADDRAFALMPPRRRLKVLTIGAPNAYLEAALLLDEYLDVTSIAPSEPVPNGPFDVSILDGVAPGLPSNFGARVYLNPPKEGSPVRHKGEIENFGFDNWQRKSPFLRWMAMENIQVTKGLALSPEAGDSIVGRSDLGPILVSGTRDQYRFLALGFDPRDSDFVLRVGWPLFLLNAINHFAEEDSGYLSSHTTGNVWSIQLPADVTGAKLRGPTGAVSELAVKERRAIHFGERVGFYELLDQDDVVFTTVAANLSNKTESTLGPAAKLGLDENRTAELTGFERRGDFEPWVWLLGACLLLSSIEWFMYHRRVTV